MGALRGATRSGSRPYVGDVSLLVDQALRDGKRVLFEGAQATLLDLDHGTYPFVTSSNPIASGAPTGIGIGPTRIDRVLGVSKAYVTRVGEGPFPSEIAGPEQARLRELGGEFGTVTGRERRCGWLDLVALRYAVRVNGHHLARADEARRPVGVRRAAGVRRATGCRTARETRDFPAHQSDFHHAAPGLAGARRLAGAARRRHLACATCRRPRRSTSSSSTTTSASRSSSSASAPRASACSPDLRCSPRRARRRSRP